jgi:hypothetical protein
MERIASVNGTYEAREPSFLYDNVQPQLIGRGLKRWEQSSHSPIDIENKSTEGGPRSQAKPKLEFEFTSLRHVVSTAERFRYLVRE